MNYKTEYMLLETLLELKDEREKIDNTIARVEHMLKTYDGGNSNLRKKSEWTVKRKKDASKRMKEYWANKNKKQNFEDINGIIVEVDGLDAENPQTQQHLSSLRARYDKTDQEVIKLAMTGELPQDADHHFWLTLLGRYDLVKSR